MIGGRGPTARGGVSGHVARRVHRLVQTAADDTQFVEVGGRGAARGAGKTIHDD